jgi:hypothetical protein
VAHVDAKKAPRARSKTAKAATMFKSAVQLSRPKMAKTGFHISN